MENDKNPSPVPFVVYESEQWRAERTEKRLVAIIILLITLLIGTNLGWLWYESQFEEVEQTYEVEQDADNGTNNFAGGDLNGTPENKSNN